MAVSASARFDALVEAHGSRVYRVCRAILRDDHLGADAAQEAFLRLWRRLDSGDTEPPRSIAAWLRKAAVSSALDAARRRERRGRMMDADPASAQAPESVADDPRRDPAAQARHRELDARLAAALRELPEGQRTIFLLRHEGGLPLREVAETLGVETTTVKTQFARACLELQSRLRWLQDDETLP